MRSLLELAANKGGAMKSKQCFLTVWTALVFYFISASHALATLEQQKIFKGVYPGKEKYSCAICHVAKLPKKDAHEMNDYGKKAVEAAGGAGQKPTAEIYQKLGDNDAK